MNVLIDETKIGFDGFGSEKESDIPTADPFACFANEYLVPIDNNNNIQRIQLVDQDTVPDGIAIEPIDENAHQMGGGEEPHNEQLIRPVSQRHRAEGDVDQRSIGDDPPSQ